MNIGTQVLIWSIAILVVFVLLTMAELWFLKRMGFDVLAHLQLNLKQGKTRKLFFEAFGVVAFVLFQPFALMYLFAWLSDTVRADLLNTVSTLLEAPPPG